MSERRCAMCGRVLEHREATVGEYDLCHPADGSSPDCYHLHTVYQKPLASSTLEHRQSLGVNGGN